MVLNNCRRKKLAQLPVKFIRKSNLYANKNVEIIKIIESKIIIPRHEKTTTEHYYYVITEHFNFSISSP